jgi:hypothetical protein
MINEGGKLINQTLDETISKMAKELDELKQNEQKLSEENKLIKEQETLLKDVAINLNDEAKELTKQKVPDAYKEHYTLLYRIVDEDDEFLYIEMTRRLSANLSLEQQNAIKKRKYIAYVKGLPISITPNKRILQEIRFKLPTAKRYKCSHLKILKGDKHKLAQIVYAVIEEIRSRKTSNDKIIKDFVETQGNSKE